MAMHSSKGTPPMVVILVVLGLAFMLVVPYGNRLMDSAASMLDPMRYKVARNNSAISTSGVQSVVIRKPLDIGGSSSANATGQKILAPAGNFSAILILTYMRSGSSLTGEIMQQHPSTFYVFEPLHSLQHAYNSKSSIEFLNGTSIPYGKYNVTEIAVQTLKSWFSCDLKNIFKRGFLDKQFLSYGKKTATLHRCLQNMSKVVTQKSLEVCITKLRFVCLSSKYRILKTIRASMRQITGLMSEIPELKIIHLVRDPRDTMMSQKARAICGKGSPDELARCSARYCYRLNDDISVSHNDVIFTNKVMPLLYEDLAFHAEEVSSEMYSFAGIELTDQIKEYVKKLTGNASKSECKVCQEPWQVGKSTKDATTHVEKWRTTMPAQFRVIVDILCKDSIQYFNYSVLHTFWPEDLFS